MPPEGERSFGDATIQIDDRGVVVRVGGRVTRRALDGIAAQMAAMDGFTPSLPTVWDFSDAVGMSEMTRDEMGAIASRLAVIRSGGGRPRVAVVTPRVSDFGVARMYQQMFPDHPAELGAFRSRAEAESWAFSDDRSRDG